MDVRVTWSGHYQHKEGGQSLRQDTWILFLEGLKQVHSDMDERGTARNGQVGLLQRWKLQDKRVGRIELRSSFELEMRIGGSGFLIRENLNSALRATDLVVLWKRRGQDGKLNRGCHGWRFDTGSGGGGGGSLGDVVRRGGGCWGVWGAAVTVAAGTDASEALRRVGYGDLNGGRGENMRSSVGLG